MPQRTRGRRWSRRQEGSRLQSASRPSLLLSRRTLAPAGRVVQLAVRRGRQSFLTSCPVAGVRRREKPACSVGTNRDLAEVETVPRARRESCANESMVESGSRFSRRMAGRVGALPVAEWGLRCAAKVVTLRLNVMGNKRPSPASKSRVQPANPGPGPDLAHKLIAELEALTTKWSNVARTTGDQHLNALAPLLLAASLGSWNDRLAELQPIIAESRKFVKRHASDWERTHFMAYHLISQTQTPAETARVDVPWCPAVEMDDVVEGLRALAAEAHRQGLTPTLAAAWLGRYLALTFVRAPRKGTLEEMLVRLEKRLEKLAASGASSTAMARAALLECSASPEEITALCTLGSARARRGQEAPEPDRHRRRRGSLRHYASILGADGVRRPETCRLAASGGRYAR